MTAEEKEYDAGCRMFASGQYAAAEAHFRSCLAKYPDNPDVLNALGSTMDECGNGDQAFYYLEQACRLRPESAPFHYNFANLLRRLGDREKAESEYLAAINCDSGLAVAFHGLGSLYLEDGKPEQAEACLNKAVDLDPMFAAALHDVGQLLQLQGKSAEAEQFYRRCLAADAHFLPALNSMGMLLLRNNRVEEARSCFQAAIDRNPDYLQARCNLAVLATWCGELDDAISELRLLAAAAPNDGDVHFNLSLALLASGRLMEGLAEHEWRFRKANPVAIRHAEISRWAGESLAGKRILIHAEQGYGDSLQFIRYADLLAKQGGTVIVEGQDAVITPLLATAPGVSAAFSRGEQVPAVDYQIPMMSLPFAIGGKAWPPPVAPYLFLPTELVSAWKEHLGRLPGLKVGLAWAGRPEHANDANRSISGNMLAALGQVPGVSFVSLQIGCGNIKDVPFELFDPAASVKDFCDSASLVASLDLVITIDSAVAHLAGSLGKPFWLLLPWNPDWRWGHMRPDSAWYPTARIFRQREPGQWSEVIDRVAVAIAELMVQDSGNADIYRDAALDHLGKGDQETAWFHILKSIRLDPEDIRSWRVLVNIASLDNLSGGGRNLPEDDFLKAFRQDSSSFDELAAIGLFFIRRDSLYVALFSPAISDHDLVEMIVNGSLEPLFMSRLLQRLCELAIICDLDLERLLTSLRRVFVASLHIPQIRNFQNSRYLSFISSLAILCFHNEYVFAVTEEENTRIEQIKSALESSPQLVLQEPCLLAILAAYYPLHLLDFASYLPMSDYFQDNPVFSALVKIQILEPQEEKRLLEMIPTLTPITDIVSNKVRQQYEENPYPRWVAINLPTAAPMDIVLSQVNPHIKIDENLDLAHPNILVAGCGTGQHSIYTSRRFKDSSILAFDLSRSSLAYAMRKCREMNIFSIKFMQGDILALDALQQQFDIVECGGVLHHLEDPLKGWKALLKRLKPGGIMGVGLYSRLARCFVNQARSYIAAKGYQPSVDNIRRFRQEILSNEKEMQQIKKSKDFFSMSGCRDMFFHVQEHQFDIAQLSGFFEELELEFLGFQLSEPTKAHYKNRFSNDASLTDLKNWQLFEEENPETFSNMYQFYVRKINR